MSAFARALRADRAIFDGIALEHTAAINPPAPVVARLIGGIIVFQVVRANESLLFGVVILADAVMKTRKDVAPVKALGPHRLGIFFPGASLDQLGAFGLVKIHFIERRVVGMDRDASASAFLSADVVQVRRVDRY